MLDVILYGKDRRGRLNLQERRFRSLRSLALFFHTAKSARWEWAEVSQVSANGKREIVRYSAEAMRGMVVSCSTEASKN